MSRNPLSILVLDDEAEFATEWKETVEAGAQSAGMEVHVEAVYDERLASAIGELYSRSRNFRDDPGAAQGDSELDDADILIIDADLREARAAGLTSGLDLAYSARCFSGAGLVLVLNAFGENTFDLTLEGHRRSYADFHLGSSQLGNPGLWEWPFAEPFRPWVWPLLGDEVRRQRGRVESLLDEDALDRPIVELLGFEPEDVQALPRGAASYLTAVREKSHQTTLPKVSAKEFMLTSEYGFARRDASAYEDDSVVHKQVLARAASARLSKWVNCVLSPAQDVLVDAPHLALRYPSQLEDASQKGLNLSPNLKANPLEPSDLSAALGLHPQAGPLRDHRFMATLWANRPLWWGHRLARSELPEAARPWTFAPPDCVFCEDSSRFLPEDKATKFGCDLETPYRIRHIQGGIDGVTYRPSENLIDF